MVSKHNRRRFLKAVGGTGFGIGLAGCVGGDNGGETNTSKANRQSGTGNSSNSSRPIDLNAIQTKGLVGKGPFGAEASSPNSVALSNQQRKKVQNSDYQVAVVFHYTTDTWVQIQERAIRKQCEKIGLSISSIQYANFNATKQVNILETIAQQDNVDGVISIPVDTAATKSGYRAVSNAGKDIVFIDNVPSGFKHPQDYAGLVTIDNRGMGKIEGQMMKQLVDSGKIIVLEFDTPFYVVDEREKGVEMSLKQGNYELKKFGFSTPDDVLQLAQDALTSNPDAKGLWAPWVNPPGAQAINAINEQGMEIPVTSSDLGSRSAVLLAEQSPLKGVGSQQPYPEGITEVNMMAQTLLGNKTPAYVALPPLAVTRENLLKMYRKVLKKDPPQKITKYFN